MPSRTIPERVADLKTWLAQELGLHQIRPDRFALERTEDYHVDSWYLEVGTSHREIRVRVVAQSRKNAHYSSPMRGKWSIDSNGSDTQTQRQMDWIREQIKDHHTRITLVSDSNGVGRKGTKLDYRLRGDHL